MIIRKAQIEEMSEGLTRAFEDEMVEHLAAFSPPLFAVIKEDHMREVIRFGIGRARDYRLTLRGPIRLYLEMMLLFGSHFDTDPQYPWAGEILIDRYSVSEMQRAEWLHARILDYQEKVSGPEGANTQKALEELLSLAKNPITLTGENFSTGMRREMIRVFPQKAEYVGKDGIKALIEEATAEAGKYGFSNERGNILMVILMYAFGHGCTSGLIYPWIERTLNDEKIVDAPKRSERLEKKAITWLEHVLGKPQEGDMRE